MHDNNSIFNRFALTIDRLFGNSESPASKEICRVAATAPLFSFDADKEKVVLAVARSTTLEQRELPPPMPFDEVILADTQGVVMLWDAKDYEKDELVINGSTVYREVMALVFLSHPSMNLPDVPDDSPTYQMYSLAFGRISVTNPPNKDIMRGYLTGNLLAASGMMDGSILFEDIIKAEVEPISKKGAEATPENVPGIIKADLIASVDCALDQLHYINLPRHYLVVNTPIAASKRTGKKKTTRFEYRPKVMLIDPEKVHLIRPRSEHQGGTHASPIPHLRRGHTRVLKAEKFKNKRWAVIHVHPTWVGPEEWDDGRSEYRVIVRNTTKG